MDKKLYENLLVELRFQILKFYLGIFLSTVSERSRVLPLVSTLAANLLVIATLNENLLPLNITTRLLLSVLLLLIPGTLFLHSNDLKRGQKEALGKITEFQGSNPMLKVPQDRIDRFLGVAPDFVTYLIGVIVVAVLFLLWR